MDRIKNKYELILGFSTLVISFSAFKDDLKLIQVDLGYYSFPLSTYGLWITCGFAFCVYLYIIDELSRDYAIGRLPIFNFILPFAYFVFVFFLFSPIIVGANILAVILYKMVPKIDVKFVSFLTTLIGSALGVLSSALSSDKLLENMKKKKRQEVEEKEIKELESAIKLFEDGYYSHSVFESVRVLETHLEKKLLIKNIRVPRRNLREMVQYALEAKLIDKSEMKTIDEIRSMRNAAIHSDVNHTRAQAEIALNFIKKLLGKDFTQVDV